MNWRRLTNHFWWKVGSLAVSVLLWLAISVEPDLVTTRSMPVYYQDLPADLLVGADVPDVVRVELRGPAGKLSPTILADAAVRLDLSPVGGPGERTFTLSGASLNLPPGVTFLRAIPSQLRLVFVRNLVKDVPVQVRVSAPPPPGYQVTRQEVSPATLRIAGPEARVKQVESAQTDAIDLAAATGDTAIKVNVFLADPRVRFDSSSVVTVRFVISKSENNQ
jgi:hypothetical protein